VSPDDTGGGRGSEISQKSVTHCLNGPLAINIVVPKIKGSMGRSATDFDIITKNCTKQKKKN